MTAPAAAGSEPAGSGPDGSGPGGWFGDYLRDPAGTLARALDALTRFALTYGPVLAPALGVTLVGVVVGYRRWRRRCHRQLTSDARLIRVLPPPVVDPAGGEAFWANLVGLLRPAWRRAVFGQPHLGFEYQFTDTGIRIQVWVPGVVPPGLVERAIQAAWPGAHTHTQPAPPSLAGTGAGWEVVVGGRLRLARSEALPIRTEFDADPLRTLLGAPLGLGHGESACVQILARPTAGRRLTRARAAAHRDAAGHSSTPLAGRVLDLLVGLVTTRQPVRGPAVGRPDPQTVLETSALNRAAVVKQRGAQYATALTYTVHTQTSGRSDLEAFAQAREVARGRAHTLAAAFAAYTGHNRYRRTHLRHPARAQSEQWLGRGDLLSVPELAALAHLPVDELIPGLERAGARALAPPPGIPQPGPAVKPLGVTDSGPARPVGLRVVDARHHLHVLGATGSGKSTLLAQLILGDAAAGRGVVLVDPKGDLVTDLLARLPAACADRVVLLDADSRTRPPCLNPLDPPTIHSPIHNGIHSGSGAGRGSLDDAAAALAVENLVSVFRRIYAAFWGPRTDDVMRAACLTLLHSPGTPTLADLPKLLTDPAYRDRITAAVTDPVLKGFWAWYEELSDPAKAQAIAPLLNKLRAVLLRPFARAALAGGPADLDMTAVLDEGGICLVRIPKGSLGDDTTRLIGSLLVARVWQTTTGRAQQPQSQRADASLVIDECHNFLNLPYPIEDMLAEARGFHLSITLAHQHLGQLPRDLREGISTNARSKIFFTAGPEDARDLARHTLPRLTDHDLSHLDAFHAAARLVLNGAHTPAFTLGTQPLPPPVPGRARHLRTVAAQHHRRASPGDRHGGLDLTKTGPAATSPPATRPSAADPRRRP